VAARADAGAFVTTGDVLLLILAAVLVIVAALLAGAEAAYSRLSRTRVEEMVRDGRPSAARLHLVLTDPARYVNVLLFLRTAAELFATVLVAVVCADRLPERWQGVLVAGGAMTLVSYVVVGVAPRTLGRQHADPIARRTAGITLALTRILGPFPRVLIAVGNALTPGKGFRDGPFASEAELRDLVDLAEESQVIERDEREMIHSVFELGDTIAREVMVPRTDIVFIERGKTVRQALSLALRSGFSRIPVVGENEDDVVGVVYLKDLARRSHDGREQDKVDDVMRPATFVPDSKPVDELLREMQAGQVHVAVVIDEYGGTAGLVTIEDILEEIVGEIADEYDKEAPRLEDLGDGRIRVVARFPVDELAELYGIDLPTDDIETVTGLMAHALGRVPIPGATCTIQGLTLTAEGAKRRRNGIATVLVQKAPATATKPARAS
jgi:CBS domain containing-hemolysin-like protein